MLESTQPAPMHLLLALQMRQSRYIPGRYETSAGPSVTFLRPVDSSSMSSGSRIIMLSSLPWYGSSSTRHLRSWMWRNGNFFFWYIIFTVFVSFWMIKKTNRSHYCVPSEHRAIFRQPCHLTLFSLNGALAVAFSMNCSCHFPLK